MTDDEVSCPWCPWEVDLTVHPMSEESAERRRDHHMERCPNRNSHAHRRTHVDVHGESVFEENSNQ